MKAQFLDLHSAADFLGPGAVEPGELAVEVLGVVVGEDHPLGAAVADALDHRGVVLLVGEDHESRNQALQGGERRIVGDIG